MKHLLLILCFFLPFCINGKGIKVNQKQTCATISIKLDKFEQQKDGTVTLTGELKQKKNFCYSVTFDDVKIIFADGTTISGALNQWNGNPAGTKTERTVSDEDAEKFVISFPNFNVADLQNQSLYLGTVLNREKTPISIILEIPKK